MRVIRLIMNRGWEAASDGRGAALFHLLTPRQAEGRGKVARVLLTGATVGLLGVGAVVALQAAALLLAALGLIYFLMTQVLGIKLDVDPRVVMPRPVQKAPASVLN